MPKQIIEVATGPVGTTTTVALEAVVHDGLAYHRDLTSPEYWTITHVPTGHKIAWAGTQRNAQQAVRILTESYGGWRDITRQDFPTDDEMPLKYRVFVAAVKPLLAELRDKGVLFSHPGEVTQRQIDRAARKQATGR